MSLFFLFFKTVCEESPRLISEPKQYRIGFFVGLHSFWFCLPKVPDGSLDSSPEYTGSFPILHTPHTNPRQVLYEPGINHMQAHMNPE